MWDKSSPPEVVLDHWQLTLYQWPGRRGWPDLDTRVVLRSIQSAVLVHFYDPVGFMKQITDDFRWHRRDWSFMAGLWQYRHARSPHESSPFDAVVLAAFTTVRTSLHAGPRPWRTAVLACAHRPPSGPPEGSRELGIGPALARPGMARACAMVGRLRGAYPELDLGYCPGVPLSDMLWIVRHQLAWRGADRLAALAGP
jgi:hypothetical protein